MLDENTSGWTENISPVDTKARSGEGASMKQLSEIFWGRREFRVSNFQRSSGTEVWAGGGGGFYIASSCRTSEIARPGGSLKVVV